jgi:hypothetical protein
LFGVEISKWRYMGSNGQEIAKQNVTIFLTWAASKTDDDFRAMASRGVLSRKEIAIECGFAKSALDQNPRVKAALRELEDNLRVKGVLPPTSTKTLEEESQPLTREPSKLRSSLDAERTRRLEIENASLKAEVSEMKRLVEKYSTLKEALLVTGRLPR